MPTHHGFPLLVLLGTFACGPNAPSTTTGAGSMTESATSESNTNPPTSGGATMSTNAITSTSTSAATSSESADGSTTTDEPISCSIRGANTCPEDQCCHQDVPGIYLCIPFGGGCSCASDRDCEPGLRCLATSLKGERNCAECVSPNDCPPGETCRDLSCEPDGATSTSGSSSSGAASSSG